MFFVVFMLFGAFDVVIRRPCRPGDHIDRITSCSPLIHGTWHIRSAASSGTAAAIATAADSLSFDPSSMTMKPIWFNHCCACRDVFVVLFVVNDEYNTNSFNLHLRPRICRSLRFWWWRQYEFIQFCACSGVFVVCSFVDDDESDMIQPCCAFRGVFVVCSVINDNEADRFQSCWKPTWSFFHRISAVGRSNPITIYSLTLIVVGSALVIHRSFALILSYAYPYASLWVW